MVYHHQIVQFGFLARKLDTVLVLNQEGGKPSSFKPHALIAGVSDKTLLIEWCVKSLTLPGVNARGFLVHRHTLKLSILSAILKPKTRSIEPVF
ncbi:MAG: hypothetical protein EAZ19_08545 [Oscillatoriales cyanobacterium]|nr:MAG: hypothetical protein EAZ94_21505 [Oscillatoriales cyanobacterium]TAE20852.1 MAG: hypothetical protein EAZ93_22200 [Oscillatoriales cyanobacterium]TAE52706.1 MAG: hypothetical protein EAZ88_14315 [Oscillatoriales cyanobacterium]TAE67184.1 MAG: hypothetical protein EAZ86_17850 [Oscillatoriales cyanobacterium]TAF93158.1 MAG: hypothetical protein EAZ49_00125 [Oscillatoriales cyanobacterium]